MPGASVGKPDRRNHEEDRCDAHSSVGCGSRSGAYGGGGAQQEEEAEPYATQGYSAPRNEVYQEFLADKRPIGTTNWWQQMDREGRGGQSRAN
jgi:hypothetical protein